MVTEEMWQAVLLHWERVLFNPWIETLGPHTCEFCKAFRRNKIDYYGVACNGCPVERDTSLPGCLSTEYQSATIAFSAIKRRNKEYNVKRFKPIYNEYRYLVRLYRRWREETK